MIPKKPNTAYFLFIQDSTIREKASEALKTDGKEAGTKQLASKLGEMWKAASSEDKARFEEEFKKDQVQFLEKQKAWQATPEFAEIESAEKLMGERRKLTESEQPDGQQAKGVKRGRSTASGANEGTPRRREEEGKGEGRVL